MFGLRLKSIDPKSLDILCNKLESVCGLYVFCKCFLFIILHTLLDLQFVGGRNFVVANILLFMSNWW